MSGYPAELTHVASSPVRLGPGELPTLIVERRGGIGPCDVCGAPWVGWLDGVSWCEEHVPPGVTVPKRAPG